jgi:hypothetical protein
MSDATLRYVLSAGRTGTVFLARLLDGLPGITAAHEPDTSRYQMMLANLRNDWGIGGTLLKRWFERARDRRIATANGVYVEVNPFLCPMTDLLSRAGRPLRIVHMVRDPATWAVSMTSHKATAPFRALIDYVPFAKPDPVPRPANWSSFNEYERALWRWNWCNSRIEAVRGDSTAYAMIRYEDLFGLDEVLRQEALATIGGALDLPARVHADRRQISIRANPSVRPGPSIDREAARRVCGELARSFGYDY